RCGTSTELRAQVIDVHPPRAGRWAKPLRAVTAGRFADYSMSPLLRLLRPVRPAGLPDEGMPADLVWRCLVPGLAQFYLGRPVRGYFFMFAAVVMAVLALILVGTNSGNLALGCLFSLHVGSISDAMTVPGQAVRRS